MHKARRILFDRKDYAAVLSGAPAVLGAAQGLEGAAAAKKAEQKRQLGERWTGLAAVLPDHVNAVQRRIDLLVRGICCLQPGTDPVQTRLYAEVSSSPVRGDFLEPSLPLMNCRPTLIPPWPDTSPANSTVRPGNC